MRFMCFIRFIRVAAVVAAVAAGCFVAQGQFSTDNVGNEEVLRVIREARKMREKEAADTAKRDTSIYIPKVHGVFRGRWELETADGYSHFQVRNARVSLEGYAAPIIKYFFNVDLCDRGKLMLLDAFATVLPAKGVEMKAGQYRMPFGYESFRGPGGYYFNNRSFIGKQVNNYRAVGVSAGYTLPKIPLSFEAGVFNPTVMEDQVSWVKKYAYAGRVLYRPGGWLFATGFESLIPDGTRINLASATVGYGFGNFYAEGEYMARWYTHQSHKTTHAYNVFASYGIPLRRCVFNMLSVQARFDGMTDLASGTVYDLIEDGKLMTTADGRRRLTVGSTLDYKYKKLRAAVRVNYEKYWYGKGIEAARGAADVLTAELIVKF